jgi:hypothetical protein
VVEAAEGGRGRENRSVSDRRVAGLTERASRASGRGSPKRPSGRTHPIRFDVELSCIDRIICSKRQLSALDILTVGQHREELTVITTVGRLTPVHQMRTSSSERRAIDVECRITKPVHCSTSVPVGGQGGSVDAGIVYTTAGGGELEGGSEARLRLPQRRRMERREA